MKFEILDQVVIEVDLPDYGLRKGDKGLIVDASAKPIEVYEVQFADDHFYGFTPDQIKIVQRPPFCEGQSVYLKKDYPLFQLRHNDDGIIVQVLFNENTGYGFGVEFFHPDGTTKIIEYFPAEELRNK